MPKYEVYATRWDDPHVISELIPARDLEFSMPLSAHGECTFTVTVEPGWSSWRSEITKDVSGVLVARDGVPVWQGWVVEDRQSGPRSFSFRAIEWGYFFTATPAVARPSTLIKRGYGDNPAVYQQGWDGVNDHQIFRDIITAAQAASGQNVAVVVDQSTTGAAFSDRSVEPWDNVTAESVFRQVAEAEGGPEWYFGTTGTLDAPVRQLYLGDRLGSASSLGVLEYVEDTAPAARPEGVPTVALLGDLFPGSAPVVPTRRAGGNVIALSRTRQGDSATVAVAANTETEGAQKRATATSRLLTYGWPRMTRTSSYSDVTDLTTLQRHADADLKAAEGFATGYSFVTLDGGDLDWSEVPRGSTLTASIDTDIYAGPRPLEFDTRVLGVTVRVPNAGPAQVEWFTATVQEV